MLRTPSLSILVLALAGAAAAARADSPGPRPELARAVTARFGERARVTWNAAGSAPRRMSNLRVPTTGGPGDAAGDAGERARRFVFAHRDLLGLDADGDLAVAEVRAFSPPDRTVVAKHSRVVRLAQRWRGLPVEGRSVVVRLDDEARVTSLTSDLQPLSVAAPQHVLGAAEAAARVREGYRVAAVGEPELVVLARAATGRVAWKVPVAVVPLQGHFFVWLDAESGAVLQEAPAAFDQAIGELPRREEDAR